MGKKNINRKKGVDARSSPRERESAQESSKVL